MKRTIGIDLWVNQMLEKVDKDFKMTAMLSATEEKKDKMGEKMENFSTELDLKTITWTF
jgi:hypothetical protein